MDAWGIAMAIIPTAMMLVLVISHTLAIMFLKKKRAALNTGTAEGAAKHKQLGAIVTILYIEIPIITALIWLVIAPAFAPISN